MQHRIDIKALIMGITLMSSSLLAFDYKLEPKQVSPSVWCFFGKLEAPSDANGGHMSNSCYIQTKDSFVVVDSGATYQFALQSYGYMQNIANLPVSTVINTHGHDDHWLGNSYYKEKFNAKLIGTPLQDKTYKSGDKTRIHRMTSPEVHKGTTIVKLDQTIDKKTTLNIGGKKISITPTGLKAHTPDDMFIFLIDEKVLFTGDLVMNGRITSNRDGSVIGQIKAHSQLNATGWEVLVPGHGTIVNKDALKESSQYFSLLKSRVTKAIDDDIGAEEISKVVTLPEFKDKAMHKELNRRNVFEAYSELEFTE